MTEDEAKTRWCPHARVSMATDRAATPAHNRSINVIGSRGDAEVQTNPAYARCLGSACMAWRVRTDHGDQGGSVREGYCGLAGSPTSEEGTGR